MTKAEKCAAAMVLADPALYEKIIDTPGFAYHFNQLVVVGRDAERGLEELVQLQAHYARLLNGYDGGQRTLFKNAEEWLERLAFLARKKKPS